MENIIYFLAEFNWEYAMQLTTVKILSALTIFIMTVGAGWYPFKKRIHSAHAADFPIGEALSAGVFLGAGLMHMLADATNHFTEQGYQFPFASLLVGLVFLSLLWLEHVGRELYEHQGAKSPAFAFLAIFMLSFHSLLAGAALGVSQDISLVVVILIAILGHKWAESFALAVQINKSSLSASRGFTFFILFSFMTPLGIFFGNELNETLAQYHMLQPIFTALAAGTFLYLGTLHGLHRAVMIERCCNLKHFTFVILGFLLMAIVAIWA